MHKPQAIDIVKPEPTTQLGQWIKWLNWMQSRQATAPWVKRVKIEVK